MRVPGTPRNRFSCSANSIFWSANLWGAVFVGQVGILRASHPIALYNQELVVYAEKPGKVG